MPHIAIVISVLLGCCYFQHNPTGSFDKIGFIKVTIGEEVEATTVKNLVVNNLHKSEILNCNFDITKIEHFK